MRRLSEADETTELNNLLLQQMMKIETMHVGTWKVVSGVEKL